jgi:hypothetical protein
MPGLKKNKSDPFFPALIILLALSGCASLPSGTGPSPFARGRQVQGVLTADETWSGLVEINDDLLVPRGVTLTIRPGTTVRVRTADTSRTEPEFIDNATELLVRGTLDAAGNSSAPIIFEPLDPSPEGAAPQWAGILFDGGGGRIVHAAISGAEQGVLFLSSSPLLSDVKITGVKHGAMIFGPSAPRLERVTIEAGEGGIYCWSGSTPVLADVHARAAEREGLVVAPGARPAVENSTFQGLLAGVLWGAAEPPGRIGETSEVTVVETVAFIGVIDGALADLQPAVPLRGEPSKSYSGESFIGWDETWEGEVLVDGTVMVAPGMTLTIRPGTVVRFAWRDSDGNGIGESELFVQGRIVALGNAGRPIVFTAAGEQGPGRWGAVNFMGSDSEENTLRHVVVESSYRGLHSHFSTFRVEDSLVRGNHRGLQFQESTAVIRNTTVTSNGSGLRFRDSTVVVENCRISENTTGLQTLRSTLSLTGSSIAGNVLAGAHLRETEAVVEGNTLEGNAPGLRATGGRVRLEGNTFRGNSYGGLQLRDAAAEIRGNTFAFNAGNGFFVDSSEVTLRENSFTGNLRFALENNSPLPVDAVGNSWGVEEGEIPRVLFDEKDDGSIGPVLYRPPLTR